MLRETNINMWRIRLKLSRVGLSRVCAQLRLDPTLLGGKNFNLQLTRMKFQINWVRSYRFSGVNQSVLGFPILPDFDRNLAESRQIWLDLMRFGRYSFGSMEIQPRFKNIDRVRVGLTRVLAEFEQIWARFAKFKHI